MVSVGGMNDDYINRKQSAIFGSMQFSKASCSFEFIDQFHEKILPQALCFLTLCNLDFAKSHCGCWAVGLFVALLVRNWETACLWWLRHGCLYIHDMMSALANVCILIQSYSETKNENMLTKMSAHSRGSCLLPRRSHSSFTAVRPARRGWERAWGYQFNLILF